MLRVAQVLLVSMASGLALGATVPKVAIQRDPTRPPSFTSAPGEAPTLVGGGQGEPSSANRLTRSYSGPIEFHSSLSRPSRRPSRDCQMAKAANGVTPIAGEISTMPFTSGRESSSNASSA